MALIIVQRLQNELFTLVTDQGFHDEPSAIWETLANVEGDGKFVNQRFNSSTTYTTKQSLTHDEEYVLYSPHCSFIPISLTF